MSKACNITAGHASCRDRNSSKFRAEQQPHDEQRSNNQRHARGRFGHGGESQKAFHRQKAATRWITQNIAIEPMA